MSTAFIPVYRGSQVWDYAWIDGEDAARLSAYRWVRSGIHAVCSSVRAGAPPIGAVAMHRFILGLARGEGIVHHRNEDGIDNRRTNLKLLDDKFQHADEPHPRRDALCGRHAVPPHERELVLAVMKNAEPTRLSREGDGSTPLSIGG